MQPCHNRPDSNSIRLLVRCLPHFARGMVTVLLLTNGYLGEGLAIGATKLETDPQVLVERTIEELRAAVVRERKLIEQDPTHAIELVDRIVSPHVDVERAGRWILGKHWRQATPSQRQQFIVQFRTLLLRSYAVHATDYTDVKINYLPLRVRSNDRAVVRTQVSRSGKPTANVDYRLYMKEGAWKVYDVTVDGVSLVATFRASVDAEVKKFGIDGLIARLIEKNNGPIVVE